MFKLLALTLLLITALWAPITPQPAAVHFKPNTSVAAALALTDRMDGQIIATTWLKEGGQPWYSSTVWANRHRITYHPNEAMTAIHFNGLTSAQIAMLSASPLVDHIDTLPMPLRNLAFFLNLLQKIAGRQSLVR